MSDTNCDGINSTAKNKKTMDTLPPEPETSPPTTAITLDSGISSGQDTAENGFESDSDSDSDSVNEEKEKLTLFERPKSSIRKPEYWSTGVLFMVADKNKTLKPGQTWSLQDATHVYCKKCKKKWPYNHTARKSDAVRNHMNRFHQDVLMKYAEDEKQRTIRDGIKRHFQSSCLPEAKRPKIGKADRLAIEEELALWLCNSLRPFSLVEDEGFLKVLEKVQSCVGFYKPSSRRTMTETIQKMAATKRYQLKQEVVKDVDYYCITTDIWTSMTQDAYLAVTLHYINQDFKLEERTLETISFPGKHSGLHISTKLREILFTFNLPLEKCSMVVRDNGSNVKLATKNLFSSTGALLETMKTRSMGCFAHTLHLILCMALRAKKKTKKNKKKKNTNDTAQVQDKEDSSSSSSEEEGEVDQQARNKNLFARAPIVTDNVELEELDDGLEQLEEEYNEQQELQEEKFLNSIMENDTITSEITEAFRKTRLVVKAFRSIANSFRNSPKAFYKFCEFQTTRKKLRVLNDCRTRWNSTYVMLSRLETLESPINEFFAYTLSEEGRKEFPKLHKLLPRSEQWFILKGLCKLLQPFASISTRLGGSKEQYVTASLVYPLLSKIVEKLKKTDLFEELARHHAREEYCDRALQQLQFVRRGFLGLFEGRFAKMPLQVAYACFLDPRYYSFIQKKIQVRYLIQLSAVMLVDMEDVSGTAELSNVTQESQSCDILDEPTPVIDSVMEDSPEEVIENELNLYIKTVKKLSKDKRKLKQQEPLLFWKENKEILPHLATIARRIFCIVATSVPSERCFSLAGQIVTKRRTRISPSNVRDVMVIKGNN